jgi:hypothetical protein
VDHKARARLWTVQHIRARGTTAHHTCRMFPEQVDSGRVGEWRLAGGFAWPLGGDSSGAWHPQGRTAKRSLGGALCKRSGADIVPTPPSRRAPAAPQWPQSPILLTVLAALLPDVWKKVLHRAMSAVRGGSVSDNKRQQNQAQLRGDTTQNPVLREGGEGSIPSFGTNFLAAQGAFQVALAATITSE